MPLDPYVYVNTLKGLADADATRTEATLKKQSAPFELQALQADTQAKQLQAAKDKNDAILQILSGVNDENSYQAAKQRVASMFGPQAIQGVPQNYDPSVIQQLAQQSLSVKDRLEMQLRKTALDRTKFTPLTVMDGTGNQSIYSFDQQTGALNNLMANASIAGKGGDKQSATMQAYAVLRADPANKNISDTALMQMALHQTLKATTYDENGNVIPQAGAEASTKALAAANASGKLLGAGKVPENRVATMGIEKVKNSVNLLRGYYNDLNDAGAMPSETKSPLDNLAASAKNLSARVPVVGAAFQPKVATALQNIQSETPNLLNSIREQNHLSARAMDSNREMDFYKQSTGSPNFTYEAAMEALNKAFNTAQKMRGIFDLDPKLEAAVDAGDPQAKKMLEAKLYGAFENTQPSAPSAGNDAPLTPAEQKELEALRAKHKR